MSLHKIHKVEIVGRSFANYPLKKQKQKQNKNKNKKQKNTIFVNL